MNNEIQFILYQLPDEEGKVQVVVKDETIGLTVGHPCRLAPAILQKSKRLQRI